MTKKRVMLDIETLGTDPGAAIVSLGAVTFGDGSREGFYRSVNLPSATGAGLSVDGDTLEWWLEQSDTAQQQLTGGKDLETALADFNEFVHDADELWANSPSFDLAIIKFAMELLDIEPAWDFYQERDFRTLKNLPGRPKIERSDEHHAMADADYQADVAAEMLNRYVRVVYGENPHEVFQDSPEGGDRGRV